MVKQFNVFAFCKLIVNKKKYILAFSFFFVEKKYFYRLLVWIIKGPCMLTSCGVISDLINNLLFDTFTCQTFVCEIFLTLLFYILFNLILAFFFFFFFFLSCCCCLQNAFIISDWWATRFLDDQFALVENSVMVGA